jgi:hypothetical protein
MQPPQEDLSFPPHAGEEDKGRALAPGLVTLKLSSSNFTILMGFFCRDILSKKEDNCLAKLERI